MQINRREFVMVPAAAVIAESLSGAPSDLPWQRKVRRVGQVNMTEHDPVSLNVEKWADYWASVKADVVLVSVTGILAFYQTKVPFHKREVSWRPRFHRRLLLGGEKARLARSGENEPRS